MNNQGFYFLQFIRLDSLAKLKWHNWKDIQININDYKAPVPELYEAQKEHEESNEVDDKADQLAKTRHTAHKQLDWPGQSEEDDDGLDWCQDL